MLSEYPAHFEPHGKSGTKVYRAWSGMLQRCTNPYHASYWNYGGRGINVCAQWLRSFTAFYDRMGDPPTAKHSLDRINNDAGYAPMNCRWATQPQQTRNRRPYRKGVIFRVDTDLKYELDKAARKAGESPTQFVERAIEARIEGRG